MSLRAKPPGNRSSTRRFRIVPTPTPSILQRADSDRLSRALDAAPDPTSSEANWYFGRAARKRDARQFVEFKGIWCTCGLIHLFRKYWFAADRYRLD